MSKRPEVIHDNYGVSVGSVVIADATDTVIATVEVFPWAERLSIEITNSGAAAFDVFEIQVQVHPDASWHVVASVSADFTSPEFPLLGCSIDMTSQPAAGVGLLWLDIKGLYAVRFVAQGNAAASASTAYWQQN